MGLAASKGAPNKSLWTRCFAIPGPDPDQSFAEGKTKFLPPRQSTCHRFDNKEPALYSHAGKSLTILGKQEILKNFLHPQPTQEGCSGTKTPQKQQKAPPRSPTNAFHMYTDYFQTLPACRK